MSEGSTTAARRRWPRIAWVVAVILAALVCFATYGTSLPPSFISSVALNGVVSADSNGAYTVIADASARRLLFLDAQDRLVAMESLETLGSPIDVVTDVCVSGDGIYVAGLRYVTDSDAISYERVLSYGFDGGYRGIVYETDKAPRYVATIISLCDVPQGVVAIRYDSNVSSDEDLHSATFLLLGTEYPRTLNTVTTLNNIALDGGYAYLGKDGFVALDYFGQPCDLTEDLVRDHRLYTAVDLADDGTVFATDDETDSVVILQNGSAVETVLEEAGRQSLHVNGHLVIAGSNDRSSVSFLDLGTGETRSISEVSPAPSFAMLKGVVWFCRGFLVVSVIAFLVLRARAAYRAGRIDHVGPVLAALAVLITVGLAIGHLSYSSYSSLLEVRAREVNAFADYLGAQSDELGRELSAMKDRSQLISEDLEDQPSAIAASKLTDEVEQLVSSAEMNGINLYYVIYGRDVAGVYYLYDGSLEHVFGSSVHPTLSNAMVLSAFGDGAAYGTSRMFTGSNLRDTTQYRLVSLPGEDGNEVIGVIEIGSKQKSYTVSVMTGLTSSVLGLLVMTLVVYLTYSELRACGICVLRFQELRDVHSHDAEALLTRPFSFLVTMLTSIDSVMTVLIARSLLQAAGMGGTGFYVTIPSVMLGVGLAIGQLVYGVLGTRLSLRKILRIGSAALCACAVFAALVVWRGHFWLYCVAKLLMAVPFGLLYTTCYSMQRRARTGEIRDEAAHGIRRTDTSAAALGTVIGGIAAQGLGSAWVYVIVAVATVPLYLMAQAMLHRGRHAPEDPSDERVAGAVGGLSFLATLPTAALALLVILPVQIANGYGSFVFPLFSADLGISSTDISNIVVLGQLAVYVSIAGIERAQARFGSWHLAFEALALLGVIFLLFSLNKTFVWAMVVIALVGICAKASDAWKGLWLRHAEVVGVSAGTATGMMYATRSLALVAQPLVLTALSSGVGDRDMIVIGAFCLACALLFAFATRKTDIAERG